MAKGKTVYIRQQGKEGGGELVQILPGAETKELKREVDSADPDTVFAVERGGSEVILEDEEEVYHQVNDGESIYTTDRGVFGKSQEKL